MAMERGESVVIRDRGLVDYELALAEMAGFTQSRDEYSQDEIWLLEHPNVFTLGQAGKEEHLLEVGSIPVVRSDRGGQVTFHGPGQLVVYLLMDIRRLGLGVRSLVTGIEQVVLRLLSSHGVNGQSQDSAHGVYVDGRKIASLGLRIRRGCCYHGFSLNVDMNLAPFGRINPCGFVGLEVVQLSDFVPGVDVAKISREIGPLLLEQFYHR